MSSVIRNYFAAKQQPTLKLLSLNIQCGGGERLSKQIEMITNRRPDVVALQEIMVNTAPKYKTKLQEAGFKYIVSSFEILKNVEFKGKNRYGNLIASKVPFEHLDLQSASLPQPERVLAVQLKWQTMLIDVWNLHVPFTIKGSMEGTLNGIFQYLSRAETTKHILCGDFNAPARYVFNGAVIEGTTKLRELRHFDMIDTFAKHRKFWSSDTTWVNNRQGRTSSFQIDYIFASRVLNSVSCRYLHSSREQKLSDHSAIEAVFQPKLS